MGFIINFRGTAGSGKTTIIREYLKRYKNYEEELLLKNGTKVRTNVCDDVVALGGYCGNKTDGLDKYNGEKRITEIVIKAMQRYKPKHIVLENLLLSSAYKPVVNINKVAEIYGYKWFPVILKVEYDVDFERLCGRANRIVEMQRTTQVALQSEKAFVKLQQYGIIGKRVNTTNIPFDKMYLILYDLLNEIKAEETK